MLFTLNLQVWREEKGYLPRKSCPSLDDQQNPFPPPKFVLPSSKKFLPPHTWSLLQNPFRFRGRGHYQEFHIRNWQILVYEDSWKKL